MIDFRFRKWNLLFRFPSGMKRFPIDFPVNHKLLLKYEKLEGLLFLLEN